MQDGIVWLIIFVLLLIIEVATLQLGTIWFAGGAMVAFLLSFVTDNLIVQIVAFLAVSLVLLFLTRPIALKYFNKNVEKTNVETLIGKEGLVQQDINSIQGTGVVVVNGMEWSARPDEMEQVIEKGSRVHILGIQGVKLIVAEKK